MGVSYDEALATLATGVEGLTQQGQAALFAACGRALQPLYGSFHRKSGGWGDPAVLERTLTTAWQYALDGHPAQASDLFPALERITPHGDDFDAPASTFAQDAVICADAALRAATGGDVDPGWIEYALEPIITSLALRELNVTDVGSSANDEEWRDGLPANPDVAHAIASLAEAMDSLKSWDIPDRGRAQAIIDKVSSALVPSAVVKASET